MTDLDLRPERRADLVDHITNALRNAVAGSEVRLRGSLASGHADEFSDIDLVWIVPNDRFPAALASVADVLATVSPVASMRVDPEHERSTSRRLLFVRLANLPLFWRIDLEVQVSSPISSEGSESADGPLSTTDWSLAASAVANAVAAVKAVLRGRLPEARGLLERGFDRIGASFEPEEGWTEAVVRLVRAAVALDPALSTLGEEVAELAVALLPSGRP